jgi:predicted esterase
LVHGRTRQVVHGGVNDAKVFLLAGFQIQHFSQAHTGIAHQRTPGFDHQATPPKTTRALIEQGQQTGTKVQVVTVPMGHHQMNESPEETLQALRQFLG